MKFDLAVKSCGTLSLALFFITVINGKAWAAGTDMRPDGFVGPLLIFGIIGVILLIAGFLRPGARIEGIPLWGAGIICLGCVGFISIYVFPVEYFFQEIGPWIPRVLTGIVVSVIAGLIVRLILRR